MSGSADFRTDRAVSRGKEGVMGEAALQLKPLKIGPLTAEYPVIQGGMGVGISLSSLAGAVAKAGGTDHFHAQIGFKDPVF